MFSFLIIIPLFNDITYSSLILELASADNNTACFKKDNMNKSNSSTYVTLEEQINDEQDTLAKDGLEEKLQDLSKVINTEVADNSYSSLISQLASADNNTACFKKLI